MLQVLLRKLLQLMIVPGLQQIIIPVQPQELLIAEIVINFLQPFQLSPLQIQHPKKEKRHQTVLQNVKQHQVHSAKIPPVEKMKISTLQLYPVQLLQLDIKHGHLPMIIHAQLYLQQHAEKRPPPMMQQHLLTRKQDGPHPVMVNAILLKLLNAGMRVVEQTKHWPKKHGHQLIVLCV